MKVTKPCKATASSGAIKCALDRDHPGHHSSLKPGQRKTAQHVTWTTIADGRVEVTTYRGGKKDGNWFEGETGGVDATIAAEVAAEREADVQREIANPSHAEERLRAGEGVGLAELVAAREAKDRKRAAKAARTFSEAEYRDDPAGVIGHASETGTSVVVGADGSPRVVISIPTADLEPIAPPAKPSSKIYTKAEREQMERSNAAPSSAVLESSKPGDENNFRIGMAVIPSASSPKVHPAADALPMIEGPELDALVADIRTNGLRHRPVLDHTGEWLVDGRNRDRARQVLGMELTYDRLPEGTNIAAYVISTNLKRRHLTESQRAIIASEIANLTQGQHKQTRPGAGHEGITQAEAAAGAGVGERTVQRANAVRDKAVPELVAAVKQGKVDLKGAEQVAKLSHTEQRKLIKERIDTSKGPVKGGKLTSLARQEAKRTIVRTINDQRVAPMPVGPFGVIYGDYPWLYDNSDQHEGSHGHLPYPGMEFEKIVEHARETAKRAAKDCIVALWVTNLYIPKIGLVLEAYGAEHRTMWTWPKPRIGVGGWARGQTEHLVIASIGDPVHTMNEVSTLLPSYQPRVDREHSSKPVEVGQLLLKHCSGPHLELFARSAAEGWSVWGAETDKFSTEAA